MVSIRLNEHKNRFNIDDDIEQSVQMNLFLFSGAAVVDVVVSRAEYCH